MSAANQSIRTCLVTGAAGGIGRALVKTFHEVGYCVIATDIGVKPDSLTYSRYVQADLARFAEDETYASKVIADLHQALNGQGLHVLINNAAVQILGGAESLTRQDWRTTLDVNLLAPFLLIQALLPELEAAKGCVVNIGSIHARQTKRNFVTYATSKAALSGMTRALAIDLGSRVRVNAIEPAAIETEMLKAGFTGKPEIYTQLERCHPQQRIGQPEEVASLALAIVEGGMNFLHGACISIDGGIGCRLYDPE
ncbi:dihydroanticapsin dehydrogenase [Methylomarinovum caldicuralii]|uniref:Dihydroanticapsin dehydrogenase n=1 Tax=Methylomarinovum caldicuralii TaxID=438856 RepID=A0AAU9C4F7_9GAMM|nr:SDR family oxidoreductase [Methylomarinovum caldicuralii]BCX80684.1 dihydroanticapsin dehydrogenase [Methylomarinovum caldicuralii]